MDTPMLKRLFDNHVFGFELRKDKKSIEIYECCDVYYEDELYKSEFLELIAELQVIADQMVN